jgi:hypothetical protein
LTTKRIMAFVPKQGWINIEKELGIAGAKRRGGIVTRAPDKEGE